MKKRLISLAAASALSLSFMTACGSSDVQRLDIFDFEPYSEEAFREEISARDEGDIAFSVNSQMNYDRIYYPDEIDEVIFENGKYKFDDRFKVALRNSVDFFAETLKKMTGEDNITTAPVSDYDGKGKGIILHLDEELRINSEGYREVISEESIVFSANTLTGLSNALFDFLESRLGCMFVTEDYDYIPSLPTIYLPTGEKTAEPSIDWRSIYSHEINYNYNNKNTDYFNEDYLGWSSKTKVNGAGNEGWYNFVHTSFSYVSPDEYFESHPEYFTLYKGERTYTQGPVSGQLCWTNEDVYEIIKTKVLTQMRENPDKHIWDVSQMDTWESKGIGCECDKCKAIDDAEGTYMGSLLTFINRLADDIKEEFPENYISTLAYNYTAEPPKNLKPRDNVIIKLCLMPGNLADSYKNPTQKNAQKAHDIIVSWGKIAKNIVIWDYNVNYKNYLMPFPIYRYMEENQQFYIDNNVYGIFRQMDKTKGAASAEMNAYMYAKLMWDNDTDIKETMNKYLTVTYGEAAPYMAKYYSDLDYNLQKSGSRLYIYNYVFQHITGFLSPSNIDSYLETFDMALESVKGNQEITDRINREKTSVLFVKAEQFHFDRKGRRAALEELMDICEKEGITHLAESSEHDDQMKAFYDRCSSEINALPLITAGIILLPILVGTGVFFLAKYIVKKNKIRKAKTAK